MRWRTPTWSSTSAASPTDWGPRRLGRISRDQIRDRDTRGHSRIGEDECDVDAVESATSGEGGDASYGLGPGSWCS